MGRAAMRDPNTGAMVPILGGVDEATADARFAPRTDPVLTGLLTALHPTASNHAATKGYVDTLLPTGSVTMTADSVAPIGWMLCQGQAISRYVYKDLYAVLGVKYGAGDASTTFNIPDMRNRHPAAYYASDTGYDTIGQAGGATDVTITQAQFPAASGSFVFHGGGSRTSLASAYGGTGATSVSTGVAAYGNPQYPQTGASSCGIATISYGGTGGSHSNVQPSIAMHFVIKL